MKQGKTKKKKQAERENPYRYEACARCSQKWNIPRTLEIKPTDYICPHCASKLRYE